MSEDNSPAFQIVQVHASWYVVLFEFQLQAIWGLFHTVRLTLMYMNVIMCLFQLLDRD